MKNLIYWFLGERAARLLVSTWNWLWGLPIQAGGRIAVEVAEESLRSMQASIAQLTESVAKVKAAYEGAKQKYEVKQQEFHQAEHQALLAQRTGNAEAARLAMSRAILIEQLLPQLAEPVAQAETWLLQLKDKLRQERQKLETYRVQTQNLQALAEVNDALATIARVNTDLQVDSARSQFDTAESAVQQRYRQVTALAELTENPAAKLTADLDQLSLEAAINQRLQQLEAGAQS